MLHENQNSIFKKMPLYAHLGTEAIYDAMLEPEKKNEELWKIIQDTQERKYKRLTALIHLLRNLIPIIPKEELTTHYQEILKNIFYNLKELPFALNQKTDQKKFSFEEKIGGGGECVVYLLRSLQTNTPSLALKVFRPVLTKSSPIEQAQILKREYDYITNLYNIIPDIVPKEHHIILKNPLKVPIYQEAAAVIQIFREGEIHDLFDFSPEQLINAIDKNKALQQNGLPQFKTNHYDLRTTLKEFCRITLEHEYCTKQLIDLFGPKNVALIQNQDFSTLTILDPHKLRTTAPILKPTEFKQMPLFPLSEECRIKWQQQKKYLQKVETILS